MPIKYTQELLEPLVKKSSHWADLCRTLGLKPYSGSQTHLKKVVIKLGIDYSHFLGKVWNKGKKFPPKQELKRYLNNELFINSDSLRKRLIRENLKKPQCEDCRILEWNGQELPLELDHVNGNPADNTLENLKILCPNCHAIKTRQDRKKARVKKVRVKEIKLCDCGKSILKRSLMCKKCRSQKSEKINWPATAWLIDEVNKTNYTVLAKQLGVTDNAIRKRIRKHPII